MTANCSARKDLVANQVIHPLTLAAVTPSKAPVHNTGLSGEVLWNNWFLYFLRLRGMQRFDRLPGAFFDLWIFPT
jgi:hypothetical protein